MRPGLEAPAHPAAEAIRRLRGIGKRSTGRRSRWALFGALLALLSTFALIVRVTLISRSMPYVGHIDEKEISARAERILQTGDFNPHFFEYPSLPIYLAASGFVVGFLEACGKQKIRTTAQIGSVDYPYYQQPSVVFPARALFAALSVLSLVLLGCVVYEITGFEAGLFLAPLIASASTFYLYLSWKYLNVDIVGALFVAATLLSLLRAQRKGWSSRGAVVSGALSGLAIACKYSLFPILLPGLLTIWLSGSTKKRLDSGLLIVAAGATFLAATPYAMFDFGTFLDDVGGAVYHYARGHAGAEGEPGWPQAAYYLSHIVHEFGPLSPLFALIGAAYLLSANWRGGVTLLSFPIAHLGYMSWQRVHFLRHAASSLLIFAGLVAIGLIVSFRGVSDTLSRSASWPRGRRLLRFAIGAAVVAPFAIALAPYRGRLRPDSGFAKPRRPMDRGARLARSHHIRPFRARTADSVTAESISSPFDPLRPSRLERARSRRRSVRPPPALRFRFATAQRQGPGRCAKRRGGAAQRAGRRRLRDRTRDGTVSGARRRRKSVDPDRRTERWACARRSLIDAWSGLPSRLGLPSGDRARS
jgi:hypothetical protein